MTAASAIVEWAWGLDPAQVPGPAADAFRLHLLDGLGCAAAAARMGAAPAAVALARRYHAPAEATILGTRTRVAAPYAALANGALVHALDFDDTHPAALVHATAAVLPALLAVGERVGASGDLMMTAGVAGYEVVARLGALVPHGFHARGLHATSVCGVFAAALVAARLLELSPGQAVNALGIAGSLASGSLEFLATGADTKHLHPGLSALAGINAAELAQLGATGPASILEGPRGLYRAYLDREVTARDLTDTLGLTWEVQNIAFKRYPNCQLNNASLDALGSLLPLDPGLIDTIDVHLPTESMAIVAEPRATKVAPRSAYDAKFSVQWCLAAMALDGHVTVDTFGGTSRTDVAALAKRVRVVPVVTDVPPALAPGHVAVTAAGGARRVGEVAAPREVRRDEVVAKFCANVTGDPGAAPARAAAEQFLQQPAATSGSGLAGLLTGFAGAEAA